MRVDENGALSFLTKEGAIKFLYIHLFEHDNLDNIRFAYVGDPDAERIYEEQVNQGCCGSFDIDITVDGKPARIGCNFGH
jgi:hypothetical protein